MATPHQLLKDYQQLLSLSQKILHLAMSGEWDALVEHEITYVQSVEKLTQTPIPPNIDSVMKLHFRQILSEILSNESKTKERLHKRMDELSVLMRNPVAQQNVNSTYGEFAEHRLLPGDLSNR
ncbi:flagella biosynthesis regulatory protein FliT [Pectobacterium cacticida]|uniref:Flagellar protein FliT n=1 Tax=Pectobacterium cacticida TaxID=69221 RepID=A0ABZ2G717_9GAMM|nr:flagella biosynthesis regulatory protein FliT [Pectobacterium cacticida]UYX05489.1 flagella biosynthesis regulatory protein FliT [Pectobacterium cacticida]